MLASSGEVHGVLGIIMDLNCLGQRLGVPAVTLARYMAAFSTVRHREAGFHLTFSRNYICRIKMQQIYQDQNKNESLVLFSCL